ncbi:MAG: peptidyl-prolyl cis-trans isomerase [Fervidobacterium sp.]
MRKLSLLTLLFVFLLVVAVFSQSGNVIGYFELNGQPLTSTQVLDDEVQTFYEHYLDSYGSFDPLFEEPYVRAFIINRLLREKVKEYFADVENLSLEQFKEKYSTVSEREMQDYYSENRDQLMEENEYVDIDYVVFETEQQAQEFYNRASQVGFQKALEEASNVEHGSYDGLKKSETGEQFIDVLFGKYEGKLRIQFTDNGHFVFLIRNHNDFSTFEKFKESPSYEEIQQKLSEQKLDAYVDSKIETHGLKIFVPESYSIWLDYVRNKDFEDIISSYYSNIFNPDHSVKTDNPWLIAGFVFVVEDGKLTEKYQDEYKAAVEKLYSMGYKNFSVLARQRQFDSSEKLVLEYNIELSKILLSHIKNEDIMSVLQYIYNNLAELEQLTASKDTQIRQRAMEYLYYMYKALGEEDTANEYYDKLLQENPSYQFEMEE